MRASQLLIPTLKETPADADIPSHRFMLRAGLIRRLAAGMYTWLPLGLRVLRKVEAIIREEMDRSGAQEVLMPFVQPAELWQESKRWEQMGPEMLRLQDRHAARLLSRPDARRGDHRHRSPRSAELQAAAVQSVPDQPEVPRRDPAAFRRDARARIHDEGRLLVPPRRGDRSTQPTRRCMRATDASCRACSSIFARCSPTPATSAAARRTNSRCSRAPAKTASRSATRATMPPTSRRPKPLAPAASAAKPAATLEKSRDTRPAHDRADRRVLRRCPLRKR